MLPLLYTSFCNLFFIVIYFSSLSVKHFLLSPILPSGFLWFTVVLHNTPILLIGVFTEPLYSSFTQFIISGILSCIFSRFSPGSRSICFLPFLSRRSTVSVFCRFSPGCDPLPFSAVSQR